MRAASVLLMVLPLAVLNAPAGTPVTFNRQIAPIIYHQCSSCHRPGEAAPFALLSYQDVDRNIAVPHEESELGALQGDVARRGRELARERMQADPALARKVAQFLAE